MGRVLLFTLAFFEKESITMSYWVMGSVAGVGLLMLLRNYRQFAQMEQRDNPEAALSATSPQKAPA